MTQCPSGKSMAQFPVRDGLLRKENPRVASPEPLSPLRRARTAWNAHVRARAGASAPRAVPPCGPGACWGGKNDAVWSRSERCKAKCGGMRTGCWGRNALGRCQTLAVPRKGVKRRPFCLACGHVNRQGPGRLPTDAPVKGGSPGIRRKARGSGCIPQGVDAITVQERSGCTASGKVRQCRACKGATRRSGTGFTKPE